MRTRLGLRGVAAGPFVQEEGWFVPPKHAVLYVIGVGGGADQEQALRWEGRLIFLEPDPVRLASWLDTPEARRALDGGCLEAYLLDEVTCKALGRHHPVPSAFLALDRYREWLSPVRQLIEGEADATARIQSEILRGGTLFYRNFYTNLARLSGAWNASSLWGTYAGIPAVVCGAGPSLTQYLPIEGAVVLAAGSGLQAVEAAGVTPHFGVAIDPHPFQVSRFRGTQVPIFYRGRWCPEALAAVEGPRIYVRGAGGYPIVEWIEEMLGIDGPILEEGPTATCLAVSIAEALGCFPIYTVGVDLERVKGAFYAPGVVHTPEEIAGNHDPKWATERAWLQGRVDTLVGPLPPCSVPAWQKKRQVPLAIDVQLALSLLRGSLERSLELVRDQKQPKAIREVELLDEPAYQRICVPLKQCVPIDDEAVLQNNLECLNACTV